MKLSDLAVPANIVAPNLDNKLLAKVNLLVGDSGCGKTSTLNTIHIEAITAKEGRLAAKSICSETDWGVHQVFNLCKENQIFYGHILGKEPNAGMALLKTLYPNLKTIDLIDNILVINGSLGLSDFGGYMTKAFQLILKAGGVYNGVITMDNVEQGFSEKAYKAVLDYIFQNAVSNDNQIFMTTNSSVFAETFACFSRHDHDALVIRLGRSTKKSNLNEKMATTFNKYDLSSLTGKDIIG